MSPLMSTVKPWQTCVPCEVHRDARTGHLTPSDLCIARRRIGETRFWEAWCSGADVPSGYHQQAMTEAVEFGEPYIYAVPTTGWAVTCTRCEASAAGHNPWDLLDAFFRQHQCQDR